MRIKHMMILSALCLSMMATSCSSHSTETAPETTKKEVAIQLYSVRDLVKDGSNLDQILKDLADMGYTSVEAANYNDGKFYGKTPQEFKQMVEKNGMAVLSSHTTHGLSDEELASGDFTEALKWWDQCIAAHKEAGMEYIVTPYLSVPKTLKDLQTYCDYYNEVGKRCQAAGLKYGYHNHAHEFQKVEDKELMLDYMLQHTNPEYVFFQMDVYWVKEGGADPVAYLKSRPSQFKTIHIKDDMEIGASGKIDFKPIFDQMYANNVRDWYVEVEQYTNNDPVASCKESFDFLNKANYVK